MTLTDQSFRSARALSHAYASGKTDPLSVTKAVLERASGTHALFISTTPERALEEATASAARWRAGAPLGVLDGVPVAWKDLFDMAGTVTTAGARVWANRPKARADAALVAAGSRAGLVAVGKTNLSEFAYSGLGLNPHFGTPANPALDGGARVPGGSSSGAAIAVAMGIVPLAIGTDTGGSVRVPAAFNGIVGYRASASRYAQAGVAGLSATLDTIGPLANSVADCVAFDATIRGARLAVALPTLRGRRFVVDTSLIERYSVSDPVANNLTRFVDRLRDRGATIGMRTFTSLERVHALIREQGWLGGLEAFMLHRALLDSPAAQHLDQRVRTRLEASRHIPFALRAFLLAQRRELIALFADELGGDTLIAPAVPHVAPERAPLEHDPELFARVNLATLSLTMPGSFLDTPAVAFPSGTDNTGLPTGVQLMRAQNDDDALLDAASAIERETNKP